MFLLCLASSVAFGGMVVFGGTVSISTLEMWRQNIPAFLKPDSILDTTIWLYSIHERLKDTYEYIVVRGGLVKDRVVLLIPLVGLALYSNFRRILRSDRNAVTVFLPYVLLFFLGADYARWQSHLVFACFLVLLLLLHLEQEQMRTRWIPISKPEISFYLLQAFLGGPYGYMFTFPLPPWLWIGVLSRYMH